MVYDTRFFARAQTVDTRQLFTWPGYEATVRSNLGVVCMGTRLPYSGLFPWGANFRYFRGSSGCHEIFYPRKFSTPCVALSARAQFGPAMFCYGSFSLLAVPLVHQVPFLKLSRVRKWTEKSRRQMHDQKKTGPVPLVQRGRA